MNYYVKHKRDQSNIDHYDKDFQIIEVEGKPTDKYLKMPKGQIVLAYGTGAVIDVAKILCSGNAIVFPNTFSGANMTSHAVYWENNRKKNYKSKKPISCPLLSYYAKTPKEILEYSRVDAICHCLEVLTSINTTEEASTIAHTALSFLKILDIESCIIGGNLAGEAIELVGTNLIHSLSYGIQRFTDISHSKALTIILNKLYPLYTHYLTGTHIPQLNETVTEQMIEEAKSYPKIRDSIIWNLKQKEVCELLK